ncbi:MAG: putative quorum-sensing-regulated virulence factor [Nitrospiria bacterium]
MDGTSPMPFGKFKGTTIEDCPSSYLRWLAEADFMDQPRNFDLLAEIEKELEWRTDFYKHFEE